MAAYADLTFYKTTFLGTAIADADFPALALRASAVIDQITFDRAAAIITADDDADTIERIQLATCAIAEEVQAQEASGGADAIVSETIGRSSVTYDVGSTRRQTAQKRLSNVARVYLGGTGLLYRGFLASEVS